MCVGRESVRECLDAREARSGSAELAEELASRWLGNCYEAIYAHTHTHIICIYIYIYILWHTYTTMNRWKLEHEFMTTKARVPLSLA